MRFQPFSALPRASSSLLIVVSRPANGISQDLRLLLLLGLILFLPLDSNQPIANAQTPATPQKYDHDKWKTEPRELFFEYEAFVLSFDDVDDDDGDGTEDRKGIPNWVSYEVRKKVKEYPAKRPKWTTDKDLFQKKIAPTTRPTPSPAPTSLVW